MNINDLLAARDDMSDADRSVFDEVADSVEYGDGFSLDDEEFGYALHAGLEARGFTVSEYLTPSPVTLLVRRGGEQLMAPSTGSVETIRIYATGVADTLSAMACGPTGGFHWDGRVPFTHQVADATLVIS